MSWMPPARHFSLLFVLATQPLSAADPFPGTTTAPAASSPVPSSDPFGTSGGGVTGGMCFASGSGNPGAGACDNPPAALGSGQPAAAVGNPVNVMTGNKFQAETDLPALPGVLGLQLSRAYNSQSRARGVFGVGWRHAYEVSLLENSHGLQIVQSDGRRLIFARHASGGCVSARPQDGRVERTARGWRWQWTNGRVLEFETVPGDTAHGRLSTIRETRAPGQPFVSLRYGLKGELVSVRDPLGRSLGFAYGHYGERHWPEVTVTSPVGRFRYRLDGEGNLLTVQRADGVQQGYYYEAFRQGGDGHNLTGRAFWQPSRKKWQRVATWTYDTQDRAVASEHAGGAERVTLTFDSTPRTQLPGSPAQGPEFETVLTNSLGQKTRYRWQLRGQDWRLLESRGAGCASCGEVNRRYGYDRAGRVVREERLDGLGKPYHRLSRTYDHEGRLTAWAVTADGVPEEAVVLTHDDPANPGRVSTRRQPSVCAGQQAVTRFHYDGAGILLRREETGFTPDCRKMERSVMLAGGGYRLTHDRQGLLSRSELPGVRTLEVEREEATGRISRIRHLDGLDREVGVYRFRYRPTGEVGQADYASGDGQPPVVWRYHHDHQARLTGITRNGRPVAVTAYDEAGRIMARLAADAGLTRWHRDSEGLPRLWQHMDRAGYRERNYHWSADGRLSAIHDRRGLGVSLRHAPDDRSWLVTDTLGRSRKIVLAGDGRPREILRLPGRDPGLLPPDGALLERRPGENRVRQSVGSDTRQGFDDWGRLAYSETTGKGRTVYGYDDRDRLVAVSKPDGTDIRYGYDAAGRRISRVVSGVTGLPPEQRPFREETRWRYDGERLVGIDHPGQSTRFRWDENGRLIAREVRLTGLPVPYITRYDHDRQGRVMAVTLPEGTRLLSDSPDSYRIRPATALWSDELLIASRRDDRGEPYYVLGNGLRVRYRYDAAGRWNGIRVNRPEPQPGFSLFAQAFAGTGDAPVWEESWGYDLAGRVAGGQWRADGQGPVGYAALYNGNDHLLQLREAPLREALRVVDREGGEGERLYRYHYDPAGNRSLFGESLSSQAVDVYRYERERLRAVNGEVLEHDAAGQPTRYRKFALSYRNGRLESVWTGHGAGRQLLARYAYNDLGQRIRKEVYRDGSGKPLSTRQTTWYLYESGRLSHELDGRGHIRRVYLYQGRTPLATIDFGKQGIEPVDAGWRRAWVALSRAWRIAWGGAEEPVMHFVHVDHTGLPRLATDARGEAVWRFRASPFGAAGREHGRDGYTLALRFPGQYADAETGFFYNHHRYYDPATGRYLTPDPLGRAGGENLYGYANQSPLQYGDPEGLLLFAFDGTGNQDYFNTAPAVNDAFRTGPDDDQRYSNVVRFRNAYLGDPDEPVIATKQIRVVDDADPDLPAPPPKDWPFAHAYYISGAGTRDQYTGMAGAIADAGTGYSMNDRSDMMMRYLEDYLEMLATSQKQAGDAAKVVHVPIDVIGFSRGAATARMFANQAVETLKGADWLGKLAESRICVDWRFVGVWDSVPHHGFTQENDLEDLKLAIPDEFLYTAHAVAMNEHRGGFSPVSIFRNPEEATQAIREGDIRLQGKTRIERGFMGAHSDIGGGYSEGDLSDVALMWMMQEARKAGVDFDEAMIKANGWDTVSNAVVHDSVGVSPAPGVYFAPGREVKYLDGVTRVSQFEVKGMGMTWEDTLGFAKQDIKQMFGQQRSLHADFFADRSCTSSGGVFNDMDFVRCSPLDDFFSKKTAGLLGDGNVDEDNKVVMYSVKQADLFAYSGWLQTNYHLNVGM